MSCSAARLELVDTHTWHRATAPVMGSVAELLLDGPAALVPQALERLRALERTWSRFLPGSELNRLHEQAGRWVHVSHELFVALRWCVRLHEETDGRFDPSIRTALERWGYDRTFRDIDVRALSPLTSAAAPGLRGLELRRADETVRLAPGLRLDLGGLGKGLAADLLAAELVGSGAAGVYLSLGGDIAVAGNTPDEGWDVPLLHPVTDVPFATHRLTSGGLVMSTVCMRRWQLADGRPAHHLIDPSTGSPTDTDVLAVAVAAMSAARAEALAKAAVVAGHGAGTALLADAGVEAWILTSDHVTAVGCAA